MNLRRRGIGAKNRKLCAEVQRSNGRQLVDQIRRWGFLYYGHVHSSLKLGSFLPNDRLHKNSYTLRWGFCYLVNQERFVVVGGDEEDRTPDLRIANATLSQLSYVPTVTRC